MGLAEGLEIRTEPDRSKARGLVGVVPIRQRPDSRSCRGFVLPILNYALYHDEQPTLLAGFQASKRPLEKKF